MRTPYHNTNNITMLEVIMIITVIEIVITVMINTDNNNMENGIDEPFTQQ